jgi:hypothetical protein
MDDDNAFWLFVIIVIGAVVAYQYYEYTLVLKYFPNMSFWDYFFLQDKIRITP